MEVGRGERNSKWQIGKWQIRGKREREITTEALRHGDGEGGGVGLFCDCLFPNPDCLCCQRSEGRNGRGEKGRGRGSGEDFTTEALRHGDGEGE
jgi:hypothetical protein